MKRLLIGPLVLLVAGCNQAEVDTLTIQIAKVKAENATLRKENALLKQTPEYYWQQVIAAKKSGSPSSSVEKAKLLVEKFPASPYRSEAKKLIDQAQEVETLRFYKEGITYFQLREYRKAQLALGKFVAEHPDHRLASDAIRIKRKSTQAIDDLAKEADKETEKRAEQQAKADAKLEIVAWHWGQTESEGYATAEGQVTNISGEAMKSVEAVVTFEDAKGGFITSDSALIEYNPILPGQTSPFSVMARWNPAMKHASLEFKEFSGGVIASYQKAKSQ